MKNINSSNRPIKVLPAELRKNGFDYRLVLRGNRSCIYEQTVTESVKYYEVFKIRVKPETTINGKVIPAHEFFPHNEAFGYWAWTFRDYSKAKIKFDLLENK